MVDERQCTQWTTLNYMADIRRRSAMWGKWVDAGMVLTPQSIAKFHNLELLEYTDDVIKIGPYRFHNIKGAWYIQDYIVPSYVSRKTERGVDDGYWYIWQMISIFEGRVRGGVGGYPGDADDMKRLASGCIPSQEDLCAWKENMRKVVFEGGVPYNNEIKYAEDIDPLKAFNDKIYKEILEEINGN